MDPLTVARLCFALTAGIHFLFVVTTLGLAPVIAVLNTAYAGSRDPARRSRLRRAMNHVALLYLLNYGIGIVSGLVMELQMGLNWSGAPAGAYDAVVGGLALETVAAFLVESTLLGLWIVSEGRLREGVRVVLAWGVAATAWLSAVLVLAVNAYLHRPVGTVTVVGGVRLVDPVALVTSPGALAVDVHVAGAAGIVGGFWLAAAGAHLARRRLDGAVALLLIRCGIVLVAVAAPVSVVSGVVQFAVVRPGLRSVGVGAVGVALPWMMLVGLLIWGFTWVVVLPLGLRSRVLERGWLLRMLGGGVWIPLATTVAGWVYREVSRQPWFIVGQVTVDEALSAPSVTGLVATTFVFVAIGLTAALTCWVLMGRAMRRAPRDALWESEAGPEPAAAVVFA
ncbi:cytochrome ubiquinol oxidase subunit I [Mariniluteicoccus flavus]